MLPTQMRNGVKDLTPLQRPRQVFAERWMFRIGIAVMAIVWASFLILGFFSQPSSDDFYHANYASELGLPNSIIRYYMGWSGRYTAISLVYMFVSVFSLTADYWIGPVCVYLLLTYAMFYAVTKLVTALSTREALFLAVTLIVLYMTNMPYVYEGLYWISGSFCYQVGNILLLFLVGLAAAQHREPSRQGQVLIAALASVVAILAVGTNEITLVILALVCLAGSGISIVRNSPRSPFWFTLLAVAAIGALVSIMAPGNFVRLQHYPNGRRFIWSLYHSLFDGGQTILGWSNSLSLWAASVLVVPALLCTWRSAIGDIRRSIWLAVIPLVWLGICFASFFPTFYSTGQAPDTRVLNVTYLFFMIGWFVSLTCIVAGLWPHSILQPPDQGLARSGALAALMIGTLTSTNFEHEVLDLRRIDKISSYINQRYSLIAEAKTVGRSVLLVPPSYFRSFALWEDELKEDPNNQYNKFQAEFFGLKSLAVEPKNRLQGS